MDLYSWGIQAGLSIEQEHYVNTVKVTAENGSSLRYDGRPTRIQIYSIYTNAVYRWNEFYIPFGLNFSQPYIYNEPGVSAEGGVGAQLGAGFQVTEMFGIEVLSQVTTIDLIVIDGPKWLDYGKGQITSLRIIGKFAF